MSAVGQAGWSWDPSLYEGSAQYYPQGRVAYPTAMTEAIRRTLNLDGSGRLLDVGCGPGSLTIPLAPLFEYATGLDADAQMLVEAERQALAHGVDNITWRQMRAEELPADLGSCRVVSFAQSFHWFDRARVATAVRSMLQPGGACVQVSATTHQGDDDDSALPHPRPPRAEIAQQVLRYLGPVRRAGQGHLPDGTPGDEAAVFRNAGFRGPLRIEIAESSVITRTAEQIVASVFSLSSAAPHLFGDRLGTFEAELRALLHLTSPTGIFSERMRAPAIDFWRPVD